MAKIYMICSVRKATEEEKKKILLYAKNLKEKGHEVRCLISDTNQTDELGLRNVILATHAGLNKKDGLMELKNAYCKQNNHEQNLSKITYPNGYPFGFFLF